MAKKKKNSGAIKYIGKGLLHLIKSPYYIGKGVYHLSKKTSNQIEKRKLKKLSSKIIPKYEEFKVVHVMHGDYDKWLSKITKSDSKIGIILGARGSGKTAFGIKFLENVHAKFNKKCFAMGFKEEQMPPWIKIVNDLSEIQNNSFILIDEGGILFSSRSSMTTANKLLSQLILIARHKNLSILFITQNSSNLEVNILRQADFLALKPSSLLQNEFERKIIRKIYEETEGDFKKFEDDIGITHIYSNNFRGFISNPLPSFWKEDISKSFK
jgi:hypothetical protein